MVHSGSVYFGNGERVSANCMRNEGGGKSLMVSSNDLSSLGKVMSFLGKTGGPQIKRESSKVYMFTIFQSTELARCRRGVVEVLSFWSNREEVDICKRMIQRWTSAFTWINWSVKTRIGGYG